jgi:hypothetical protein
MDEGTFIEDEVTPSGAMAWTPDGRGIQWCAVAGRMYIPVSTDAEDSAGGRVRLVDKIIRERFANTGVSFKKRKCSSCGGWHLERG